jgi:hypothetical protein
MTTDLVQQTAPQSYTDLTALIQKLTSRKVEVPAETPAVASAPVALTPKAKALFKRTAKELETTSFPTTRRVLTDEEKLSIMKLHVDVKAAAKEYEKAVQAARTAVFNHLDLEVEEAGIEAEIDSQGHYLASGTVVVPGSEYVFNRQLHEGTPEITTEALQDLVEDGILTQEEYDGMTYQVVTDILDVDALLAKVAERPELTDALATVINPGKPVNHFTFTKNKA